MALHWLILFSTIYSHLCECLGVDARGDKRGALLRNLSSSEVKAMADTEARLQINHPHLVLELALHAADSRAEQINSSQRW
jgi:hypothetical protein